ncbi:DNA gyrase/topoisomerase IV subunit A [Gulosibacter molinativorax]|uniref:DNA topoisomerase (ATP-hydrolyzing) n=1 Tax=Gulosibacter molinativorax TaxID=256821 RepID=A0ABT7C5G8_9MICO|nr:DNA topoisomerase IV subunit A [Gulosibacter molinativorax]MDJ1370447.1 DNA topoisomerase IV subunit A [Gulosibacter molinativorax]QUY61360.1 DNA topoisomerase (ATP-hydrolyzing) [Gulosibacter molinativorax]
MATTPSSHSEFDRIEDVDVSTEMRGSFLEYAYSVIYSRALPDARDGMKPVQRRILYQMTEMGLRPDRGHVKSARVVGDVMGKLHPHGDSAIYDAMARLAQPFTQRVPLIDGHGNFGSLDDGPAAPRYTEARLTAAALALTESLDEDVVDFVPNYDNSLQQPEVLPAAWPNLLVNGASGIAVGMATNMAPHNLGEVISAAQHLLEHPDATLAELMRHVPGPDLPGGARIIGLDGVREAYETGRGSFRMRATAAIENVTARRKGIVISELPYLVGPEKVIERIKQGVQSKKLTGISSVTDLTDRKHGMKLVIELKTGFVPEAVLEQLYRHTPLEESFHINNVALVDGAPQTLGLRELLDVYLRHRISVVRRRSEFRLGKRRDRLHLIEGLLIAILDIDEVIQIIRSSDDADEARGRLQIVFDLSERQAEYILELRLRRLTKFSRIELEAEADQLRREIEELEALLGSEDLLRMQVSRELGEAADQFSTPRRTVLIEGDAQVQATSRSAKAPSADALQMPDVPTRVLLSTTGKILRVELEEDGSFPRPRRRSKHDAILADVPTSTLSDIGAVTNTGVVYRATPVSLPASPAASALMSAGVSAREYFGITDRKEQIVGLVPLGVETPLALATKQGVVKRVNPAEWKAQHEMSAIALKPGDEVVGAARANDDAELVFVTSDAQLLHYSASLVRPQGAGAGGMAGIRLGEDARVISFSVLQAEEIDHAVVVTIAEPPADEALFGDVLGSAKISEFGEFPAKGRATGGVRAQRFVRSETALALAWVGPTPVRATSKDGSVRPLPDGFAKRDASGTQLEAPVDALGCAMGDAPSESD